MNVSNNNVALAQPSGFRDGPTPEFLQRLKKKCKVFLDFENLNRSLGHPSQPASPRRIAKAFRLIAEHFSLDIEEKFAFADWADKELHARGCLTAVDHEGFKYVHAKGKRGSNAADLKMFMEIGYTCNGPNQSEYWIIASGDSDFCGAVNFIKQRTQPPAKVIVVAVEESVSPELRGVADDFISFREFYDRVTTDEPLAMKGNTIMSPTASVVYTPRFPPEDSNNRDLVSPQSVCDEKNPFSVAKDAIQVLYWTDKLIQQKPGGGAIAHSDLLRALTEITGKNEQILSKDIEFAVEQGLIFSQTAGSEVTYCPDNHEVLETMRNMIRQLLDSWAYLSKLQYVSLMKLATTTAKSLTYHGFSDDHRTNPMFWINFLIWQGMFTKGVKNINGIDVTCVRLVDDDRHQLQKHEESTIPTELWRFYLDAAVIVTQSLIKWNKYEKWIPFKKLALQMKDIMQDDTIVRSQSVLDHAQKYAWLHRGQYPNFKANGAPVTGLSLNYENQLVKETLTRYRCVAQCLRDYFQHWGNRCQDRATVAKEIQYTIKKQDGAPLSDNEIMFFVRTLIAAHLLHTEGTDDQRLKLNTQCGLLRADGFEPEAESRR